MCKESQTSQTNNCPVRARTKHRLKLGDVLKFLIFFGIGLFFIYWFLLKLSPDQRSAIWESFKQANWWWVAALACATLLSHYVRAIRWRLLFKPIGHIPSHNNTFGSVMVAYLANLAFPRLGEVMRCATLRISEKLPMEKSIGTVVTERLFDMLAFGAILLMGLLVMFGKAKDWLYDVLSEKFAVLPRLWIVIVAALLLATGMILIYRNYRKRWIANKHFAKVDKIVVGAFEGIRSIFRLDKRSIILFLLYSIVLYTLYIIGGWLIFKAFEETSWLGLRAAFVVYIFGSVGMMISQGGLGAYPVLVWQALAIYGISEVCGLSCGWLIWSAQQAVVIAVGMIYMIYFSLKKRRVVSD